MKLFAPLANVLTRPAPISYPLSQSFGANPQQGYLGYSRAYMHNEIVFSAIEMLATSAGEPHIVGRRWQRESPQIRNEAQRLLSCGLSHRDVKARLIANGFFADLPNHPEVRLLNNPNPWMSRGQMSGTIIMDECLAGNSYWLKARVQEGLLRGATAELWRLRPDRVKIIPSKTTFIEGYEYSTGQEKTLFQPSDVIHFKTRHPLNDYYGMPPLMPIAGLVDIEDYMKSFLRTFFERGGTGPGSILSVKQKLSPEAKDDIKDRFKRQFGGSGSFHEMMILDSAESTYQQMGLARGLRDALPADIYAQLEAGIAMVFGIPASILGTRIGMESSSYANKRQDWQVFWDLTMTPKLSDMDDVFNLQLTPDYSGIDEVAYDLSDIRALEEDVDKIQKRHRDNLSVAGESWEEFREAIGLDPEVKDGTFFIPSNLVPVRVKRGVIEMPEPAPPPAQIPEKTQTPNAQLDIIAEVYCPKCGRWLGRNLNAGGTAFCPKDKEVPVGNAPTPLTVVKTVERDEDGRGPAWWRSRGD